MVSFILRRLAHSILVMWGITTIVFFLTHLSDDPTSLMLPPDASYVQRQEFRHSIGRRPLIVQYGDFLRKAVRLDFGTSIRYQEPAMDLVLERVPATLELSAVGLAIALLVALPMGILAALKQGSIFDTTGLLISLSGQSFPVFWVNHVDPFILRNIALASIIRQRKLEKLDHAWDHAQLPLDGNDHAHFAIEPAGSAQFELHSYRQGEGYAVP